MQVSVLLARSPLLVTRKQWTLHYLAYKDAIERAHTRTLDPSFYFKEGTLNRRTFESLVKKRGKAHLTLAENPNEGNETQEQKESDTKESYSSVLGKHKKENVLFQIPISVNETQRAEISQYVDSIKGLPTPDPDTAQIHELHRLPEQTLYFVVKNKSEKWSFPVSPLDQDTDFLHTAADRLIETTCGKGMKHFVVGKVPVSHQNETFYMRARHVLGSPQLRAGQFAWLSKQELEQEQLVLDNLKHVL